MSSQTILATLLDHEPMALLAKVSAVLVAAACASFVLSRASAAIRHLVWFSALAACLALALVSPVAPRLAVPLIQVAPIEIVSVDPVAPVSVSNVGVSRVASFGRVTNVSPRIEAASTAELPSAWMTWLASHASSLIVALWLLGCVVVLGRCLLGHAAVRRLERRSRVVESSIWSASLDAASRVAGVDGHVRILASDALAAPVTSGWIHPVILVPADADEWSDDRRHVVLVHELAHVGRLDYLAQLIATLACALFWFHPLAWLALSRLRAEAEQAADDRVLASGTSAVAYAGHLLDLARVESGLHLSAAVAVGMVKASRLEGRFRAMLDNTRSRAAVSRSLQTVAASFTLAAVIPLAGLRAGSAPLVVRVPVTTSVAEAAPDVASASIVEYQVPTAATTRRIADSTIELTADGSGADRVSLDLETGGSVAIRGWDEPRVRVRAQLAGPDWRDTDVRLARSGGVVRLRSEFIGSRDSRSTRHVFEVWVPRRMNVDVKSAGGSLVISNVHGEFSGHTGGGTITIEGASGDARLTTGGGDVRVTNSSLSGAVSTGGGQVEIYNAGTITGSSGSGPVVTYSGSGTAGTVATTSTIAGGIGRGIGIGRSAATAVGGTISGGVAGSGDSRGYAYATGGTTRTTTTIRSDEAMSIGPVAYTLKKAGGDIVIEDAPNGALLTTGGGRIHVGSATGNLAVSTGGGSIDLPRVGGNVSASTGAGDVTITVVNTDGTEHSVNVFSGKGRAVIELPADLDATFELETAYTETHDRTNIDSDFPLDRSETQAWDESMGSPRKFVRARGTVGNGRGLIRVRVVNGDITVRRK